MSEGPLHGIRVLEFSQVVAGPIVGLMLADLGADVVKVESPDGDSFRRSGSVVPGTSKSFQWYNRGKRSLVLDLRKHQAQTVVHRLMPDFDVVVTNYRNGVPERLGIDYESLCRFRPDLIYARITGFGPTGPWATEGGSDIVGQAYSGLMADDGQLDESGAPRRIMATPIADLMAGLSATVGITTALFHRALTGEGQLIDASLVRGGMAAIGRSVMREPVSDAVFTEPAMKRVRDLIEAGAEYADIAEAYGQGGMHATGAVRRLYHTAYQAKDGVVVVGALTKANREAIRRGIGLPDEGGDDPDFDPMDPATQERVREFKREVQRIMRTRTVDEWVERLRAEGAPAGPMRFPQELADDAQTGPWMVELEDEITGWQQQLGPLMEVSRTPTRPRGPAPVLGRHSEAVLQEHGFDEAEIEQLRQSGAVHQAL